MVFKSRVIGDSLFSSTSFSFNISLQLSFLGVLDGSSVQNPSYSFILCLPFCLFLLSTCGGRGGGDGGGKGP